jgi:fluoride ion exporter CrcB/FEX
MSAVRALQRLQKHGRVPATEGLSVARRSLRAFSAEVVSQLNEGRFGEALAAVAMHVLGSVGATFAGIGTVALLRTARTAGG